MLDLAVGKYRLRLAGYLGRLPSPKNPWQVLRIHLPRGEFGFVSDEFTELEFRAGFHAPTGVQLSRSRFHLLFRIRVLGFGISFERQTGF